MSSLKLTSFTPLNSQTKKKVIIIWKMIYDNNDSLQFRSPVDWKGMGLVDYLKYVQRPMDLNTISRKIRQQKYRTVQNVLDDIDLIFDNCKVYNAPGSWIYNLADKLQKSFIKMIRNFIPKMIDSNPKSKINLQFSKIRQPDVPEQPMEQQPAFFIEQVSYNDKIKFTDKLTHINSENLQTILRKIIQKNPSVIKILPRQDQQQNIQRGQDLYYPKQEQKKIQTQENTQKIRQLGQMAQKVEQLNNTQKIVLQKFIQPQIVESKMQREQINLQKQRPRRQRSSRNYKNQIKQIPQNFTPKISIDKMQIGTKTQIFIDDLPVQSFEQLMKMLEGMVEQKDKVMKKIKLD